ncbi:hypothetical protein, partial [Clostridium sediminicola]|uniref:hypothetical protein n=1 Tax=Clostridium sediminicola TaxID=3114879 RepID=UPI003D17218B
SSQEFNVNNSIQNNLVSLVRVYTKNMNIRTCFYTFIIRGIYKFHPSGGRRSIYSGKDIGASFRKSYSFS